MTYAVLVPLKATARGKSRLGLPDRQRSALAVAMVRDTLAAAASARSVCRLLVVAEDAADRALLAADGVEVLLTDVSGLNEAIAQGAAHLASRGWSGPVAVLPGDLPFLTGPDLAAALDAAAGGPAVVADVAGTGTTLLVAESPAELRPRFGPNSYRRHQVTGARPLPVPAASTLHQDVDTVADLRLPADFDRLGPHTRAALADLALGQSPQVTVLP